MIIFYLHNLSLITLAPGLVWYSGVHCITTILQILSPDEMEWVFGVNFSVQKQIIKRCVNKTVLNSAYPSMPIRTL
jgi:hypothetical protein